MQSVLNYSIFLITISLNYQQLSAILVNGQIDWQGDSASGCSFQYNDYNRKQTKREDCHQRCASTSGCTHYDWTSWNGGTCFLKKGKVNKSDAKSVSDSSVLCGVISSPRISNVLWNGNDYANGCDFTGGDLSLQPSKRDECFLKCTQNHECTHYVWTSWNGGTCFLKKGLISKNEAFSVSDSSTLCGVIGISWIGDWAHRCDFVGNDIKSVKVRGEDCSTKCSEVPECTHFAWWRGDCFLKRGAVSKSDAQTANSEDVCGIIPINWENGNWAHNCDFPGNDISSVNVIGENCGSRCLEHPTCTHFHWTDANGGTCYLKRGRVTKADAKGLIRDYKTVCGIEPSKMIIGNEPTVPSVKKICNFIKENPPAKTDC